MKCSCKRTGHAVKTKRIFNKLGIWVCAGATLWLSGCASTTTFTAYPSKINPIINTVQAKSAIDFNQCLLSECQSNDAILYFMERGRFAQIQGNADVSMQDFAAAMEKIKQNDEKARVSLSNIGANVAATLVNDNAIPYEGSGYERVMLHHYQALNYLNKHDLEGAGVEVRRANAEQEDALKRHEGELEKAEKDAQAKKVDTQIKSPELSTAYAQMDEVAGKVKNSFQNAATFYLSGFIYEAMQQPNDAYIDYKKALEIYPDNTYLQKDVMRLAKDLNMSDDLESIRARFQVDPANMSAKDGDVLVLFEDGFAPQKQQVKVSLPVPNVGLLAIAFPIYREKWTPHAVLSVEKNGEPMGATEPICDFRALSVKALKEQVPVITTRQVIRLAAKAVATKEAKDKLGVLGQLGMSAWNGLSENADLRSWISLPADVQVLHMALPAGNHKLTLKQAGVPATASVDVNVAEGSRTIVHVIRTGQQFYASVIPVTTGKAAGKTAAADAGAGSKL